MSIPQANWGTVTSSLRLKEDVTDMLTARPVFSFPSD
jgi:hypothetical protein